MRFIKAIFRKLGAGLKNQDGNVAVHAARCGTIQEALTLRIHFRFYFLAHGAAQQVGFRQRVARQILGRLLHLFLIGDDAEGFLQDGLKFRMQILNRFLAELAGAIGGYVGHGARPVQRHQRNQILKPVSPHLAHGIAHAGTFQLEHAHRIALRQHVIGGRIIQRDLGGIKFRLAYTDEFLSLVDNRKGFKAQEVELHQAGFFRILHVELGCRKAGTRVAVKRHKLFQRPVANHNASRMG